MYSMQAMTYLGSFQQLPYSCVARDYTCYNHFRCWMNAADDESYNVGKKVWRDSAVAEMNVNEPFEIGIVIATPFDLVR